MTSDPRGHWQTVYETKAPTDVSWYQPTPQRSLALIQSTGLPPSAAILDVGGGASTLVDHLLAAGFSDITVLDVAPAALEAAKARLGAAGAPVQMIAADVTAWQPAASVRPVARPGGVPLPGRRWRCATSTQCAASCARARRLLGDGNLRTGGSHALQWPGRAALRRRRAERGAWAGVPPRHERDRGAHDAERERPAVHVRPVAG